MDFSPMLILAWIVFGILGFYVFRNGKRNSNPWHFALGLALMCYPYVTTTTWITWLVGCVLMAGVYITH